MPRDIITLHLCTTNDHHDIWLLIYLAEYTTTDQNFCHFGLFLSIYPPKNSENQNFGKMKNAPGNTIYASVP